VSRIAVIDIDETLLQLTAAVFADRGWETTVLPEPESAAAVLALSPPDLIVMDLWLTGPESGWPILRQLRDDPATRDVPLIVWSAVDGQVLDRDGWLRDQRIPVLGKPFELADLLTVVESALSADSLPQGA
jgi:DNA-binding response OmpR family regulator